MFNFEIFAILFFIVILFLGVTDWRKRRRFKRYLKVGTDILFHQMQREDNHVTTGTLGISLLQVNEKIKGLLISSLSFRNGSFSIPSIDRLYLNGDDAKYVSVGFRIRRHDLRPLRGKMVRVLIKGKLYFKNGETKEVKASIVVCIPILEEHPIKA